MEFAFLKRDLDGNIIINNNGTVTCVTEGGVQYEFNYDEIDFNCENLKLCVDDKTIFISLHNNTILNKENEATHEQDSFAWSDSSTKLFLSLYKDCNELLQSRKIKTKKMMWNKIALEMQKDGYKTTSVQVENKYKSLERSYKNMKLNNKKTGRGRMSCAFETELTELLGSKHNIEPLAVCGSEGLIIRENQRKNISLLMDINNANRNSNIDNSIANRDNFDDFEIFNTNNGNINSAEIPSTDSNTDSPVPSTSSKENNLNRATTNQSKKKNERKHLGATARMLESCQETIKEFATNIKDGNNNKYSMQKEMLEEYKKIRLTQEEFVKELKRANNLKEEKNKLLKEIFTK